MPDGSDAAADRVDVRGLPCPRPVAVVRRRLTDLDPGAELVVVGESTSAEGSIRRACETHGFDVREAPPPEEGGEAVFALRIHVTEYASL